MARWRSCISTWGRPDHGSGGRGSPPAQATPRNRPRLLGQGRSCSGAERAMTMAWRLSASPATLQQPSACDAGLALAPATSNAPGQVTGARRPCRGRRRRRRSGPCRRRRGSAAPVEVAGNWSKADRVRARALVSPGGRPCRARRPRRTPRPCLAGAAASRRRTSCGLVVEVSAGGGARGRVVAPMGAGPSRDAALAGLESTKRSITIRRRLGESGGHGQVIFERHDAPRRARAGSGRRGDGGWRQQGRTCPAKPRQVSSRDRGGGWRATGRGGERGDRGEAAAVQPRTQQAAPSRLSSRRRRPGRPQRRRQGEQGFSSGAGARDQRRRRGDRGGGWTATEQRRPRPRGAAQAARARTTAIARDRDGAIASATTKMRRYRPPHHGCGFATARRWPWSPSSARGFRHARQWSFGSPAPGGWYRLPLPDVGLLHAGRRAAPARR